jgi:hypothetical protein
MLTQLVSSLLFVLPFSRALWYPDWEGSNTGCAGDGNEPLYMTQNPTFYLFSKADCCAEYFYWNYEEYVGSSPSGSGSKYYADWLCDDTCKNDGNASTYSEFIAGALLFCSNKYILPVDFSVTFQW